MIELSFIEGEIQVCLEIPIKPGMEKLFPGRAAAQQLLGNAAMEGLLDRGCAGLCLGYWCVEVKSYTMIRYSDRKTR